MGAIALSQQEKDALTFPLDDDTEKPLSIGHKSMHRTLKIFVNFCQVNGTPIDDWNAITKEGVKLMPNMHQRGECT